MIWNRTNAPDYHTHHHTHNTTVKHGEKKVTVTENKAPTDDSIRLANEMKEKLISNILGPIKTDSNFLSIKAMHFEDNMSLQNKILIQYTLNGNDREVSYDYEPFIFSRDIDATYKILEGVRDTIAKDIASYMLPSVWGDVIRPIIQIRNR
jgi:hypothetical protein